MVRAHKRKQASKQPKGKQASEQKHQSLVKRPEKKAKVNNYNYDFPDLAIELILFFGDTTKHQCVQMRISKKWYAVALGDYFWKPFYVKMNWMEDLSAPRPLCDYYTQYKLNIQSGKYCLFCGKSSSPCGISGKTICRNCRASRISYARIKMEDAMDAYFLRKQDLEGLPSCTEVSGVNKGGVPKEEIFYRQKDVIEKAMRKWGGMESLKKKLHAVHLSWKDADQCILKDRALYRLEFYHKAMNS